MKTKFKKNKIIVFAISIAFLIGCSKDETEQTSGENYSKITHLSGEQTINGTKVIVSSSTSSSSNWCDFGPYWAGYTGDGFYEFSFTPQLVV